MSKPLEVQYVLWNHFAWLLDYQKERLMFGEFRLLFGGFEPNDTNSVLLQTPEWFLNLATY